jgi:hypothetical protein
MTLAAASAQLWNTDALEPVAHVEEKGLIRRPPS